MAGSRREIQQLMKSLGAVHEGTGKHLVYRINGRRVCVPNTPSDRRTLKNLKARVSRRLKTTNYRRKRR